jgi:hypothetical protein
MQHILNTNAVRVVYRASEANAICEANDKTLQGEGKGDGTGCERVGPPAGLARAGQVRQAHGRVTVAGAGGQGACVPRWIRRALPPKRPPPRVLTAPGAARRARPGP